MIKIEKLNKFFNKGKPNEIHVINDISLELPDRGMVAIFGKSGCGKTTLLNVIGGLDSYGSGTLTVDGNDIRCDTDVIRNKYIGYIFQNYNLNKTESCYDNVADALRLCGMSDGDQMKERVMAALRNVGLENYHGRTPDTLSGGQQQRIAIARAIVKNPQIILADEPTGNLDEANTLMIMDLLKEISKDHLVLLVTHEANLVDYYCDTVIELRDGKVFDVRNNEYASGYTARGKNDIYLGELEHTNISDDKAQIEYYGDTPDSPLKLTVVNSGGKLYIRVNTPKVQILDETSEVRLHKGVYEQKEQERKQSQGIDMSKLPPVKGERFGRLFSTKNAIKSGYAVNFKKSKKGKKLLRGCMCLFAAVVVFMSAVFGTSFSELIHVNNSYNHNVFYVYTGDASVSEKLVAAVGAENAGVDYIRLYYGVPNSDMNIKFMTGYFESFASSSYDDSYKTNAVLLDIKLTEGMKTVVGKREGLDTEEIVITTRVADALLKNSSLGYIQSYNDLIGLITPTVRIDGKNLRVAGVVESNESAVYLGELAMARYIMQGSPANVATSEKYGSDIAEGETVLATRYSSNDTVKQPKVGENIKINGRELKVARVIRYTSNYDEWLKNNGINIEDQKHFDNESYFEYCERYYAYYDEYMSELYMFDGENDINVWLYVEKGLKEVKYNFIGKDYYVACEYKNEHGRFPTSKEFMEIIDNYPEPYEAVESAIKLHEREFYDNPDRSSVDNVYYVNDKDYIAMSKQNGETHESALIGGNNSSHKYGYSEEVYVIGSSGAYSTQSVSSSNAVYTVVHSNDPERTAAWLESEFYGIVTPEEYMPDILTPHQIFDKKMSQSYEKIITSIIAMILILAVMGLCMYFIMRSSLMNRIKEIGIYRAIGVSKKNLVFRFFVESVLLTTLTVFIGYIITSVFLGAALSLSPMMVKVLYYPIWLAGTVLAVLYALCLFFGTLPILSLLRKTPSQILAKYDI